MHTGVGKESSTRSNVNFVISGESSDSGVRKLTDGKLQVSFRDARTSSLRPRPVDCDRNEQPIVSARVESVMMPRDHVNRQGYDRFALSSKEFSAGSVRNFIMSVETPLGPLLYLRVWHDNSGQKGKASWFLNMINVLDLQTGEK